MSYNSKKTPAHKIRVAGATRRTIQQSKNFNPKIGVTKIPGIGFKPIADSALTGKEAVIKQRNRNLRKNPSNGIGVGY